MEEAQRSAAGTTQPGSNGIVDRVKQTATARLTTQKDLGTDALGHVAEAVRSGTQKLRDEQHDTIATYIDKAADHIEQWSSQLRQKNVTELVSEVQQLARRRPAVFIGSAFALGLVTARFLKSSGRQAETADGNESFHQPSRAAYGPGRFNGIEDESVGSMATSASDDGSGYGSPEVAARGPGGASRGRSRRSTTRGE